MKRFSDTYPARVAPSRLLRDALSILLPAELTLPDGFKRGQKVKVIITVKEEVK